MAISLTRSGSIKADGLCLAEPFLVLRAYFLVTDLSISVFVLVLFSRKLVVISVFLPAHNLENSETATVASASAASVATPSPSPSPTNCKMSVSFDRGLLRVIRKTYILMFTAVATTQCSVLVLTAVRGNLWHQLDAAVNCWCIVFMFKPYHACYASLCRSAVQGCVSDRCSALFSCYLMACGRPQSVRGQETAAKQSVDQRSQDVLSLSIATYSVDAQDVNGDANADEPERKEQEMQIQVGNNTACIF